MKGSDDDDKEGDAEKDGNITEGKCAYETLSTFPISPTISHHHIPDPSPKRARWSFSDLFRLPKTTFQRVLQNQVQIDFNNENDDFCDENSNNFDGYGDENDQKTDEHRVCNGG